MSKFAERAMMIVAPTLIVVTLIICARPFIDWPVATDPRWAVWTGLFSAAATILGSGATLGTVIVMLRQIREDNRRAIEIRRLEEVAARRASRRDQAIAESRTLAAVLAAVIHMSTTLEIARKLMWPTDESEPIRPVMAIAQLESIATAFESFVQLPVPMKHMPEMVRLSTNCRVIAAVMRGPNFASPGGKDGYTGFVSELNGIVRDIAATQQELAKLIEGADVA